MESKNEDFKTIDEYIKTFPGNIQKILEELRATIKQSAPDAGEKISYRMPTFTLNGNLVHFAAFKAHIGFYPTPGAIVAFKEELAIYKSSKGAVQFPVNEPLPLELISRIVKFRVQEALNKAAGKPGKNKKQ